ncbi:ABC transporter permease [Mycolicibacterium nivoides]|nr:ABC transporter permease [Mycolicibacterium nivoides]MBN3512589.1 ABC transporter permease [Mycolicibacterium septicum]
MVKYILGRALQTLGVVFGGTMVIFALAFALPTNPAAALAGERAADPAFVAAIESRYHLNEPLWRQYLYYVQGLLHGDFGQTVTGQPIAPMLAERLSVSAQLAAVAVLIACVLGIGAGMLASLNRHRTIDHIVRAATLAGLSIPFFVIAFVLQLVVGVKLQWLPVSGLEAGWKSFLLPGFVLAVASTAYITRLTRSQLIEQLDEDYVRLATAKGLGRWRVVRHHALRNSLIPVVTFAGIEFGALFGGAVIVELIFNIPGLGQALARAIYLGDKPAVVGIVTAIILVYALINLAIDAIYLLLDPRIRHA